MYKVETPLHFLYNRQFSIKKKTFAVDTKQNLHQYLSVLFLVTLHAKYKNFIPPFTSLVRTLGYTYHHQSSSVPPGRLQYWCGSQLRLPVFPGVPIEAHVPPRPRAAVTPLLSPPTAASPGHLPSSVRRNGIDRLHSEAVSEANEPPRRSNWCGRG